MIIRFCVLYASYNRCGAAINSFSYTVYTVALGWGDFKNQGLCSYNRCGAEINLKGYCTCSIQAIEYRGQCSSPKGTVRFNPSYGVQKANVLVQEGLLQYSIQAKEYRGQCSSPRGTCSSPHDILQRPVF